MERKTNQRTAIRQVLKNARRPLSPAEVHRLAKETVPKLGIATVYRTLKSMHETGLLSLVFLPGEAPRYEWGVTDPHPHFHCRDCGRVYELDAPPGPIPTKGLLPEGFQIDGHTILYHGVCRDCQGLRSEAFSIYTTGADVPMDNPDLQLPLEGSGSDLAAPTPQPGRRVRAK
ncbi:MAG: transcriptional repressor [Sumerlaeia bacterium]